MNNPKTNDRALNIIAIGLAQAQRCSYAEAMRILGNMRQKPENLRTRRLRAKGQQDLPL